MPRAPWVASISLAGRRVAVTSLVAAVRVLEAERHGLAGPVVQRDQERGPAERAVVRPVDVTDDVAGLDAGRGGRRVGLDGTDLEPDGRVADEGDAGEDRRTPAGRSSPRRRPGSASWSGSAAPRTTRGSSASSPSSPSSLTKPPIGSQFSVYRVSPFERRTLARGGKPIPNSRTRTRKARAVTKWPSSWMITSAPRMTMNRTIVTIDWAKPVTRMLRTRWSRRPREPRRRGRRGHRRRGPARRFRRTASTAASSRRGMPGEVERPVEEAAHGDLVGGDQRGRGPRTEPAGLAGDAQRREARLVGGAEVEPAGGDEVGRRRPATGGGRGRSGRTGWGGACRGCPAGP